MSDNAAAPRRLPSAGLPPQRPPGAAAWLDSGAMHRGEQAVQQAGG